MAKLVTFLKGKKTYIVASMAIVLAVAQNFVYVPNWVFELLLGAGAATMRDALDGIKKDSKEIIENTK